MSELDKDIVSETNEGTANSDENLNGSESNTDSSESNKKFDVWKEYKRLKKENKVLQADKDDDFSEEEKEAEQEANKNNSFDENRFDILIMKNKAEEYESEIKETLKEFPNMTFDKAIAFAKANYTKSETKTNFSTKSATPKKDLKDYSKEEIVAMKDPKQLLAWSRANGEIR